MVPPDPVPTLNVTVITVGAPAFGVMAMCPVYIPAARPAALADTVRVTGLAVPTVKLPPVTAADNHVTSGAIPIIPIAPGPVVDSVTFCDVAGCADAELN